MKQHRPVNDQKLNEAKQIVEKIVTKYEISQQDLLTGRHNADIPYFRRLIIYFVRNATQLQHHYVAPLVGFARSNNAATSYKRVMTESRTNDRLKSDILAINSFLNK